MAPFARDARCSKCGQDYVISGASVNPGSETEASRLFPCGCGGFLEAFIPGSVNLERVVVTAKAEVTR